MRIVPGTKSEYAHIELEAADFALISKLQKQVLESLVDPQELKGLRIEISAADHVPENVRKSLAEGRFFVVK